MATTTASPTDAIHCEVFIAAPPHRVFRALTDPTQLPRWWGQPGRYRTTSMQADLRPGGRWRTEGDVDNQGPFHVEGEYLVLDPPTRLSYTWIPSWNPQAVTTVDITLQPVTEDGRPGTRLKLQHFGFTDQASNEHYKGWVIVFDWLRTFLEDNATIDTRTPPPSPE